MRVPNKTWSASLLFCLLFVSCSPTSGIVRKGEVLIKDVPFYPQEDFQCGPASLAEVLNYLGLGLTPEEIAREIFSTSAGGTLTIDMSHYAERKGYIAVEYSGGIDDLREKIEAGYPLIIMVDKGFSVWQRNHFMVVAGYNDDGFIVNSGRNEHEFIGSDKLTRVWSKTGFWSLAIKKK